MTETILGKLVAFLVLLKSSNRRGAGLTIPGIISSLSPSLAQLVPVDGNKVRLANRAARAGGPHLEAVVLPEDAAVNGLDDHLVLHA